MSIKLSVGVAKKLGQPRFSSIGASCTLELELTPEEAAAPTDLQRRLRRGFDACRAAVEAELAYQRRLAGAHAALSRAALGDRGRRATAAQIRAVHAIVRRRRLNLHGELAERCDGRELDELSLQEASRLIDELASSGVNPVNGA